MKQNFDELLYNLKKSIANYKYYTDFEKVFSNVNKYKVELNILNSLIGSNDIENEFLDLMKNYPKVLNVIPLLLAVRKTEIAIFDQKEIIFSFRKLNHELDMYVKFMNESGLFDLMSNNRIKSLFDYITGVEVGLDTNARKNRTGTAMENIVESFISSIDDISYHKEINKEKIKSLYGINIDKYITSEEGQEVANKRFDFAIKTPTKLFLIETNFYSGGGSKLNETARSFKSLAKDINKADEVTFVWITDGVGWNSAKRNLKETYDIMEHLYTLTDLEKGVLKAIIK